MPPLPPIEPPSLFRPRPVRVWVVLGLFVIYLIFSFGIFFESIAPVANFHVEPTIGADSPTYWAISGVRTTNFADQEQTGPKASSNLFGPVLEAQALRTDLNVALFNTFLFVFSLMVMRAMPEFDRATFLLLMMANPFLLASLISLNKEIFSLAGIVVFIRYTNAKTFRWFWLSLALILSLFARWQQVLVMLIYVIFESAISPVRGRRRWGIAITVVAFTVGYGLIYRIAPAFFSALLAQAEAGHTILIMDDIQANFGFPLVAVPKILMNCLGHFAQPAYFLKSFPSEDFTNWRDHIFMPMHTFLLSALLLGMFFTRRLRLKHATVYLLVLYLLMTAINPMVQPRYEYAAYVLLCMEASRYFRLGEDDSTTEAERLPAASAPGTPLGGSWTASLG